MSRICKLTKKVPIIGNCVSHANNKTKKKFFPNLQYKRVWFDKKKRWRLKSIKILNGLKFRKFY